MAGPGPGLGAGHREWGVVGAGVGTKVDEPPSERLEGRRLQREPAPHSSLSTLALVTWTQITVNWTGSSWLVLQVLDFHPTRLLE